MNEVFKAMKSSNMVITEKIWSDSISKDKLFFFEIIKAMEILQFEYLQFKSEKTSCARPLRKNRFTIVSSWSKEFFAWFS